MTMGRWMIASTAAIAFALAGCGGGGGGGGAPSAPPTASVPPPPAPTPAPAPPPAPPPPVAVEGPIGLTQLRDFITLGWSFRFTTALNGADVQGSRAPDPAAAIDFRYLADEQAHELRIPGFDWGRLRPRGQFGAFTGAVVIEQAPSQRFYGVNLFRPGDRNPVLPLLHTSLGSWEASRVDPDNPTRIAQNFGEFAYGVPTEPADMPRDGTATYRTYVNIGQGHFVGDGEMRFDFGAGTFSGMMTGALNDGIGGLASIGRCDFAETAYARGGTIFSGRLAVPGMTADSFFEGRFTGPQASELMVRWRARVNDPHNPSRPTTLHGVWVGKRV